MKASSNFSAFEQFSRQTYPDTLFDKPDLLYDACVLASFTAYSLAYHLENKFVTANAPLWDNGENSEFGNPNLKIISAGNFKPKTESSETETYTRVCAEQNLIDNALRVGDTLLGALFIRATENIDKVEGTKKSDAIAMCKPCRGRSMRYLGPGLVVVSFKGDSLSAIEATTIEQQIQEHDFDFPHETIAKGADEVKEFVVEEIFKTSRYQKTIDKKPDLPSRRYRRKSDK